MSHLGSLFPVKKVTVLAAAYEALEAVKRRRDRLLEKAIDKEMKRWFRRPKSREEARERLLDPDNWSGDMFAPDYINSGWGTEWDAEKLIDACKLVDGDYVYLSTDDVGLVKQYSTVVHLTGDAKVDEQIITDKMAQDIADHVDSEILKEVLSEADR